MDLRKANTFLDHVTQMNYNEPPATVQQILCDDEFLGTLTNNGKSVYPVWHESLEQMMTEDSKYMVVLTGAIGIGKTRAAIRGMIIAMQRILCLKDPWAFFNLEKGGKMAVVFFNLSKSQGKSKGFTLFQSYIKSSPWFRRRGILHGTSYDHPSSWLEIPLFDFKIGSPYMKGFGSLGEDVILSLLDEIDSPDDSEKQKIRVVKAFRSAIRRHESRFVIDGESLGKCFLVSSKQDEMSFLEPFITEMKGTNSVFVVDVPLWVAKPDAMFCGETFPVCTGDMYHPPSILENQHQVREKLEKGFKVLDVPVEFRTEFERDIVGALKDLAGESVASLRKSKLFPSEEKLKNSYDKEKQDPFSRQIIQLSMDGPEDLIEYMDLSKIRVPKGVPRYGHTDIAFSSNGDTCGLAMSSIRDYKDQEVELEDGRFELRKMPVVETDFVVGVRGRDGQEIPMFKLRKFILDLRLVGFNICGWTYDLRLASFETEQILQRRGIETGYLSLDRTREVYYAFRDVVREGRWIVHESKVLHFELANLEDRKNEAKIDHPEKVSTVVFLEDGKRTDVVLSGSKDLADAAAGSVHNAIQGEQTPPDTAKMKEMMKKIRNPATKAAEDPNAWYADLKQKAPKDPTESKEPKRSSVNTGSMKEIFRRIGR